jgi:hypothetical protein
MITRTIVLAGGVAGAAMLSQFPEYAQQYTQRLGGAVDALGQVVADFDASATAEGLSREQALAQMTGTAFVERRRDDMRRSFDRYARLRADLDALNAAGPFMRAYHGTRLTDPDIAGAALEAFKPAVPVTFEGAIFAGVGFGIGAGGMRVILALLRVPWRRRRTA